MLSELISAEISNVFLYRERNRRVRTAARSFAALSFRLAGSGVFRTPNGSVTAPEGSVAFVPPALAYERISDGESIVVFHFAPKGNCPDRISIFTPKESEGYRALFLEAMRLWDEKKAGYRFAVLSIFYRILARIEEESGTDTGQSGGNDLAKRAADEIRRHFRDPGITVSALASMLYVSEAYLRRRFKEAFSVSPKQYLDRERIGYAKILLETGYYTQKEIAFRCGYSDVKYFRTAFKTETGLTPREYRREARGE